jgi:hypothetical protein
MVLLPVRLFVRPMQKARGAPRCVVQVLPPQPSCDGARDGCQSVSSRSRAGSPDNSLGSGGHEVCLPHCLSFSIHHQAGLDCNQYYHLLWLPDCSGRKTEQCAERHGEPSRGFGVDRPAGYRFAQGRSADRAEHSPSAPQRSQPKCPRLRYRSGRVSLLTSPWITSAGVRQRP